MGIGTTQFGEEGKNIFSDDTSDNENSLSEEEYEQKTSFIEEDPIAYTQGKNKQICLLLFNQLRNLC